MEGVVSKPTSDACHGAALRQLELVVVAEEAYWGDDGLHGGA